MKETTRYASLTGQKHVQSRSTSECLIGEWLRWTDVNTHDPCKSLMVKNIHRVEKETEKKMSDDRPRCGDRSRKDTDNRKEKVQSY